MRLPQTLLLVCVAILSPALTGSTAVTERALAAADTRFKQLITENVSLNSFMPIINYIPSYVYILSWWVVHTYCIW